MAYTFSHRCGDFPRASIICWPDIPLAPATIARSPLNDSGIVGRPWKIPSDWIVRICGEDIVIDSSMKLLVVNSRERFNLCAGSTGNDINAEFFPS